MGINFDFYALYRGLFGNIFDRFFTPFEFTNIHLIACIVCFLLLTLGIGWVQDSQTRRQGVCVMVTSFVYLFVAFAAISWLPANDFKTIVWITAFMMLYEYIFMHIMLDTTPLGSLVGTLLIGVAILALSVFLVFPLMKIMGIMLEGNYYGFISWTSFLYFAYMTVKGIALPPETGRRR